MLAARRRDAHVRADFSHSLARLAPRPAWYAPPDAAPPLLPPRSHCCWSAADAACGATPRRQLVRIDDAARTSCVVCQVQSNASLVTVRAVGSGLIASYSSDTRNGPPRRGRHVLYPCLTVVASSRGRTAGGEIYRVLTARTTILCVATRARRSGMIRDVKLASPLPADRRDDAGEVSPDGSSPNGRFAVGDVIIRPIHRISAAPSDRSVPSPSRA